MEKGLVMYPFIPASTALNGQIQKTLRGMLQQRGV